MTFSLLARIFRKDLAIGPRSPILAFALVMPLAMTVVLHLVFGQVAARGPRLVVVDAGGSDVTLALLDTPGIGVTVLDASAPDAEEELRRRVEANDFDAGLVLQSGFDADVRAGTRPRLNLFIGGESYAANRAILTVTTIDAIRAVEGRSPPVSVDIVDLGSGDPIPLTTRFIPVVAMYAFIIAGLFVPASSLVEERERRTVVAVLATPARLGDVLGAKALLGMLLAIAMTAATLALNGALGPDYGSMLGVLVLTSVFWALMGLIVGLLAKNSETLFAIVKGSGVFLMAPVVFYLFPDWPQWIARVFPTYWAIDPLWQIVSNGASLGDVWIELSIVAAMSVVLVPAIIALGKRMERQLASG